MCGDRHTTSAGGWRCVAGLMPWGQQGHDVGQAAQVTEDHDASGDLAHGAWIAVRRDQEGAGVRFVSRSYKLRRYG